MTVPLDLDGAAAVLTGAGSGIGRATAISLAARGARIVASDLDAGRAEETAALITAAGGEADRSASTCPTSRTSRRSATAASSGSVGSTSS